MGQRGPDRADHRHFTNSASRILYMLFSHLAIIDLDKRADQPFSSENKCIIFNGEMYNYLERRGVRDELLANSPVFDHIRRDKIETLISKEDLSNSESKFLFYFLNTKLFLEDFDAR